MTLSFSANLRCHTHLCHTQSPTTIDKHNASSSPLHSSKARVWRGVYLFVPLSLVRNCKFQSNFSSLNLSQFKIFKVSLFTQGICYYYGVRGEDERQGEEERSRWVLDISRAMRLVTQSLFPPFDISCDPIDTVANTRRRLMASVVDQLRLECKGEERVGEGG